MSLLRLYYVITYHNTWCFICISFILFKSIFLQHLVIKFLNALLPRTTMRAVDTKKPLNNLELNTQFECHVLFDYQFKVLATIILKGNCTLIQSKKDYRTLKIDFTHQPLSKITWLSKTYAIFSPRSNHNLATSPTIVTYM